MTHQKSDDGGLQMISVVVSIYNMEEYLYKCVESLLNQTYQNYEILLIDDGSTDNCGKICDEFEAKEEKIKTVHKQNGGVSSARNCGIKQAKGEWIVFPDPDDWVEPNYLQKLIDIQIKNDADLSICGHYYSDKVWNKTAKPEVMNNEKAMEYLMYPNYFSGYSWNKLYSLNLIIKNNLFFDEELGMIQDLHFNVRYFQFCNKIAYDPEPVYHYVIHDSLSVSSTNSPLTPRKINGIISYEKIAEVLRDKYPVCEEIAYASLCVLCLKDIIIYYRFSSKDKKILALLKNSFIKYKDYFYRCKVYTKKGKRFSRLVGFSPRLYYYIIRVYKKVNRELEKYKH